MKNLLERVKETKVAYTHAGVFHADDVFSSALLKYINPEIEIKRVFNITDLDEEKDLIFDIGAGEFDHHQPNNQKKLRDNFIPYAAFGLLWKELGTYILGEKEAKKFDEDFVQSIDYSDNTGISNTISSFIASFNPNWNETISTDKKFNEAVDIALSLLGNKFKSIIGKQEAVEIVEKLYEDASCKQIIVFPRFIPWQEVLVGTEAQFVIFPSNRGGYNLQIVPNAGEIPRELWGAKEFKLDGMAINEVKGMTFCHPGGFLASFDTVENAYNAAKNFLVLKAN